MVQEDTRPDAVRILVTLAAFVIVIAGMNAAQDLLVPFLLAAFIAILVAPLLLWLKSKRLPTWAAFLIVIIMISVLGILVFGIIGQSINSFMEDLPRYQDRFQAQTDAVQTWLDDNGFGVPPEVMNEYLNVGAAMDLVGAVLGKLGGMLANSFLILLTVIFMLLEASSLPEKLRIAFRKPDAHFWGLDKFVSNVNRYMGIKSLTSLGTGLFVAIWLWILGVDFPILWGLLAFMLNFVPNIGSIIAAIPAIMLALVQLGPWTAFLAAIGYLVVNNIVGNIIEPRFMGRGLGLSTLVVFISLVFWGFVLGPVGMFLSVPLTMTVKIALQGNKDTRWLAILLGSETSYESAREGVS